MTELMEDMTMTKGLLYWGAALFIMFSMSQGWAQELDPERCPPGMPLSPECRAMGGLKPAPAPTVPRTKVTAPKTRQAPPRESFPPEVGPPIVVAGPPMVPSQPPIVPPALGPNEVRDVVNHNGSIMAVTTNRANGFMTIVYAEPKPSLWEIGVRPGTLLVDGYWQGPNNIVGRFVGRARVFNLVCGAIPYDVTGGMVNGVGLVLEGPQLRVNQFCQPYYLEWTENSVLTFQPINPVWR